MNVQGKGKRFFSWFISSLLILNAASLLYIRNYGIIWRPLRQVGMSQPRWLNAGSNPAGADFSIVDSSLF